MRRNDKEIVRAVLEWRTTVKRPRGRPWKKVAGKGEKDLKIIGVT